MLWSPARRKTAAYPTVRQASTRMIEKSDIVGLRRKSTFNPSRSRRYVRTPASGGASTARLPRDDGGDGPGYQHGRAEEAAEADALVERKRHREPDPEADHHVPEQE